MKVSRCMLCAKGKMEGFSDKLLLCQYACYICMLHICMYVLIFVYVYTVLFLADDDINLHLVVQICLC